MSVTIKFRRGTSAEWTSNGSTVLASGEPGYEVDTGRFKIGNGATAWSGLSYASVVPSGFLSGSGVSINLGSNGSSATISVSGLNSGYIGDFNSAVSGLLPVKNILSGTGISVSSSSGIYTINSTGSGIFADQAASIVTTVFNKTASTIPKMSAVYIDGGQGDQPTIQLAIATGDLTSAATYGITYEAISSMSTGRVIVLGALSGLNTDQFNPTAPTGNVNGSVVYLSPSVSGSLTTTKPYAPNHLVSLGTIIRTHQNEGVIEVRIQNGFELEELHNVVATGVSNNQGLIYNSASGLWYNTTLTSSLISDFNEAVDDRVGSGLFAAGTGINLNYNDAGNSFTVSVTGLINNPTNNRILTSRDSTTTGIDAESNLTFDGGNLIVGSSHTSSGSFSTIAGGGSNQNYGLYNFIGGGTSNTAGGVGFNVIVNGATNIIPTGSTVFNFIGNGSTQTIRAGDRSFIGGGSYITISGNDNSIVGGGSHFASGTFNFIGGGISNGINSSRSSIVGGASNRISSTGSFIGGGISNSISGLYSAIIAGSGNNDGGYNNVFILGSNITGTQTNTTYVQNIIVSTGLTASTGNFTTSISGALLNIDNIRIDGNTISSTNPSGSIIINPSGNGSLQRDSGGNARGQYAIDWQTLRSAATQVASGDYSVIGGGRNNTNSGYLSTVAGGRTNTSTGTACSIGGGRSNTASNTYSTVGGGRSNSSTGYASTVAGGFTNSSTNTNSTIAGGSNNTSSGICSAVGGGRWNVAGGDYSAILGGQFNNAVHTNVFILGSGITSTQADTTYVQNLDVSITGDIDTLRINKFYHNNLSVATGVADSDLLITIVDPTGTASTQVISGSGLRNSLLNQPAVLRFRQGTNAERLLITPASGEPIWTTDTQKFYIGDGSTVGGDFVGPSPYDRSSGTQSIVALNTGCVVSGDYSVVGGGYQNSVNGDGSVIAGGGWYNAGSMQIEANTISGDRSFIGGGANNTITQNVGVICGGRTNSIGGYALLSAILGGYNNSITANGGCSILGGINNNISGSYSSYNSICGGRDNSITVGATVSVIGGGSFNTSSGYYSVIGGGSSNTIAGDRYYNTIGGGFSNYIDSQGYHASTIAGGYQNTISGDYSGGSSIGGGHYNTITSNGTTLTPFFSCIPGGLEAKTTRHGELSHAAGKFANVGDAQHTVLIARRTTTDATANQILYLDNSSLKLILPAKTTWTFEVKLSAYNDTDSAGAGWIFRGAIRRNGSNGTALIGTVITENWQDSAMSSTSANVIADDTNEALQIRVTGLTSKNIRWVAVVDISQVSYGTP